MKPKLLLCAALIAGLGLLWLRFAPGAGRGAPASATRGADALGEAADDARGAAPFDARATDGAGTPALRGATAPSEQAADAASAPTTLERAAVAPPSNSSVRVRVEVFNAKGEPQPAPRGVLHLRRQAAEDSDAEVTLDGRGSGPRVEADVVGGWCSLEPQALRPDDTEGVAEYRVLHFDAAGFRAFPDRDRGPVAVVAPSGEHVVSVFLQSPVLLHVLSAETAEDLEDVEVAWFRRWRGQLQPRRSRDLEPLVSGVSSPVLVPGPREISHTRVDNTLLLLVGAPGYASRLVELPPRRPESALVELRRSGTLELTLEGPVEELEPQLRVTREIPDGAGFSRVEVLFSEDSLEPGLLRIENLESGSLQVELSLESTADGRYPLERTSIELAPGGTHRETLSFEAPRVLDRVRVTGRLRVAEDWQRPDFDLQLLPTQPAPDGSRYRRGSRHPFAEHAEDGFWVANFEFDQVYPGPHRLALANESWSMELEVPPQGLHALDLEVPAACEVRMVFVDEEDQPLELQLGPMFFTTSRELGRRTLTQAVRVEGEPEVWTVLAPTGPLLGWIDGLSARSTRFKVEVTAAEEQHRIPLPLDPSVTLSLSFEREGDRIDVPSDLQATLLDEIGQPVRSPNDGNGRTLSYELPPDRRIEVRLARPAGYEAIEPFVVDTGPEESVHRVIGLIPLR